MKTKKTMGTLEEQREEILAKGRRFRYPVQYTKHRLVINTIVISVAAILIAIGLFYMSLYRWQDTGDVMFRITKALPFPVAEVDGKNVRFSDYLMIYRSSLVPVERQNGKIDSGSEDGRALIAHYKGMAMEDAISYTYAMKVAEEIGLKVSDEAVAAAVAEYRTVGGVERSEESFNRIIEDNFGLSRSEYERLIRLSLVRKEVSVAIDEKAGMTAGEVERLLAEGKSFEEISGALTEKVLLEGSGGLVDNMNLDGGRAEMAAKLSEGGVSGKFVSKNGDGYYFVLLKKKTETAVEYSSIKVPFTEFTERIGRLREEGKINEYIAL